MTCFAQARIREEEERRLTAGITYKKELLAVDVEGEGEDRLAHQ